MAVQSSPADTARTVMPVPAAIDATARQTAFTAGSYTSTADWPAVRRA